MMCFVLTAYLSLHSIWANLALELIGLLIITQDGIGWCKKARTLVRSSVLLLGSFFTSGPAVSCRLFLLALSFAGCFVFRKSGKRSSRCQRVGVGCVKAAGEEMPVATLSCAMAFNGAIQVAPELGSVFSQITAFSRTVLRSGI